MSMTLDYGTIPFRSDGFGDVLGRIFPTPSRPPSNATAITFESVSGKPCGMRYPPVGVDSPGRVVFLSFPFDALANNGPATG